MNLSKANQLANKSGNHYHRLYRGGALELVIKNEGITHEIFTQLENKKKEITFLLSRLESLLLGDFTECLYTGEGDLHIEILNLLGKLSKYGPRMEDKEKMNALLKIFEQNLPLYLFNRAKSAIGKAETEIHPEYGHPTPTLVSNANDAFIEAKVHPENSDNIPKLQTRLEALLGEVTPQKIAIYNLEMFLSRFEWSINHPDALIRPGMMPGEFNMEYQLKQVIREAEKYPENEGLILALASRIEAVFEYQKQSRNK